MKRIGIMGGTFNPIHNGHLAIAERAREQFDLEKIVFLPSGVPYMKNLDEVLPASVRCEMTALAIADVPYFELSDMEASDEACGKNTYTYETLEKFKNADPVADYYFILGTDSLQTIAKWKHPERIFQNCTILAAVRGEPDDLFSQISGLQKTYDASIEILTFQGMDISSTKLREMIRDGLSVHGFIPEKAETYILEHHLYQNDVPNKRKEIFNEQTPPFTGN